MKQRKICIVTGTRAEYGLLHLLIKAIEQAPELALQLVVTGTHLSPEFGLTYREIEKEFAIDKKLDVLQFADDAVGISKTMGLALDKFAETFAQLKPDLLVVLGDRYEIFSATIAATVACIPIAHIHGGETTEGAMDEAFRHAITKMSHLHFAATNTYKKRIIQLGEHPQRVFNVGGLAIDNILQVPLLNREQFCQNINFNLNKKNLLVTFHPVTLEKNTSQQQFNQLLQALDLLHDTNIIFTKANADTHGRIINKMIDEYTAKNSTHTIAFASLGLVRYLSALQFIDACVGNSSSGLLEAPSFHIGTINIGDRQKGRLMAESIINCQPTTDSITKAIQKLYTEKFQAKLPNTTNPYGQGGAVAKIVKILKTYPLTNILKKQFFDIEVKV